MVAMNGCKLGDTPRRTVESCRSIDVREWVANGLLRAGFTGGWEWKVNGEPVASIGVRSNPNSVLLDYRVNPRGRGWERQTYSVQLSSSPCHFGSNRKWFLCPATGCGRRVAKLYLDDAVFACRHCCRLAYTSSNETAYERTARKAEKVRRRLEWKPGLLNGYGPKPKRMRWNTFERLSYEAEILKYETIIKMGGCLGIRVSGACSESRAG